MSQPTRFGRHGNSAGHHGPGARKPHQSMRSAPMQPSEMYAKVDQGVQQLRQSGIRDEDIEVEFGSSIMFSPSTRAAVWSKIVDILKQTAGGNPIAESQQLDVHYMNKTRRRMVFVDGVNQKRDTWISKKPIINMNTQSLMTNSPELVTSKLRLATEIPAAATKSDVTLMRAKRRWSVPLRIPQDATEREGEAPMPSVCMLEVDLVKDISTSAPNLKELIGKLFTPTPIEVLDLSLWEELRVEIEVPVSAVVPACELAMNAMLGWFQVPEDVAGLQGAIYGMASNLLPRGPYLESFKVVNGLKKLLNSVVDLNTTTYKATLAPDIHPARPSTSTAKHTPPSPHARWLLTDKADGQRTVIHLRQGYVNGISAPGKLNLISSVLESWDLTETTQQSNILDSKEGGGRWADMEDDLLSCVVECEAVGDKLYAFDLLELNRRGIHKAHTSTRLAELRGIMPTLTAMLLKHTGKQLEMKTFVDLWGTRDSGDLISEFHQAASHDTKYNIDGLIFTEDAPYFKMRCFKWKPLEMKTIDFYVKKVPDHARNMVPFSTVSKEHTAHSTLYVLMVGISKKDMSRFGVELMPNWELLFEASKSPGAKSGNAPLNLNQFKFKSTIPVQFSPSLTTNTKTPIYLYQDERSDLDGKVVELGWDGKWVKHRVRDDRDVEVARGDYFGNYYSIAELTWQSIMNPLRFEQILKSPNEGSAYFKTDNNLFYKQQRAFNSFVKTHLMSTLFNPSLAKACPSNARVVDLASGKGQDLSKLINLRVANGLFIDVDSDAIDELVRRKHFTKGVDPKAATVKGMSMSIINMDLTKPYGEVLAAAGDEWKSSDLVVCNFAFHYLCPTVELVHNIAELVMGFLKPGSRFLLTCFDGALVANLLKGSASWILRENQSIKYRIDTISKLPIQSADVQPIHGQRVGVLLPFSNGELVTESLMDLQVVDSIFESTGFSIEGAGSFEDFFPLYNNSKNVSKLDHLNSQDMEFIRLYSYRIYQKQMGKNIIIKSNLSSLLPGSSRQNSNAVRGGKQHGGPGNQTLKLSDIANLPNAKVVHVVGENASEWVDSLEKRDVLGKNGYRRSANNSKLRTRIVTETNMFIPRTSHDDLVEQSAAPTLLPQDEHVVILMGSNLAQLTDMFQHVCKIPTTPIVLGSSIIISGQLYKAYLAKKMYMEDIESTIMAMPPMSYVVA